MEPTESSTHVTARPATRLIEHQRVGDQACVLTGVARGRWSSVPAGAGGRSARGCRRRFSRAVRVAACGGSVDARGTERKPLAALGLGLTAALRVRAVRVVAPVAAWSATRPAPRGRRSLRVTRSRHRSRFRTTTGRPSRAACESDAGSWFSSVASVYRVAADAVALLSARERRVVLDIRGAAASAGCEPIVLAGARRLGEPR